MKFNINDKVIITAGKDKGKKSVITKVLPKENKVVVKDVNLYVKHIQPMPMMNRPGERTVLERPIEPAKIAILNQKGQPDRIGYQFKEDGTKQRIFKKTGQPIPYQQPESTAQEKADLQAQQNEAAKKEK